MTAPTPEKKPDAPSRPAAPLPGRPSSAPPPGPLPGTARDKPSPFTAPLAPGGALDTLGRASLMGLHLVSGMLVGALLGYGLDRWFGTFPWCSGVGFLFGLGAGFRNMWIDARYLIRQGEGRHADPRHVDEDSPRR